MQGDDQEEQEALLLQKEIALGFILGTLKHTVNMPLTEPTPQPSHWLRAVPRHFCSPALLTFPVLSLWLRGAKNPSGKKSKMLAV
jgi:hypothetical protein